METVVDKALRQIAEVLAARGGGRSVFTAREILDLLEQNKEEAPAFWGTMEAQYMREGGELPTVVFSGFLRAQLKPSPFSGVEVRKHGKKGLLTLWSITSMASRETLSSSDLVAYLKLADRESPIRFTIAGPVVIPIEISAGRLCDFIEGEV